MAWVDTSPEIAAHQARLHASMSPEERVILAFEMSELMFSIAADGIRARHPAYSSDEVEWALRRVRLGDELFRAAWPHAPLLDA